MSRFAAPAPAATNTASAWAVAAGVPDPELPMLTIADLGILRRVDEQPGGTVTVTITPTYSGCPAMREIALDVVHHLERAGFATVDVRTQLQPAWTSDWITDAGRAKLAAAGIAPPHSAPVRPAGPVALTLRPRPATVACPHCGGAGTVQTAAFSATACKALYRCRTCAEPFESVKAI